jgi:hypothetical protein
LRALRPLGRNHAHLEIHQRDVLVADLVEGAQPRRRAARPLAHSAQIDELCENHLSVEDAALGLAPGAVAGERVELLPNRR